MKTHREARVLLALVIMFFALSPALQYGAIWDHRAHPTPGVTVVLRDGQVYTGTLSREWSKDWVLYLSDNAKIQFGDHGYQRMEFRARDRQQPKSAFSTLFDAWRSLLPMVLISGVCLVLLVSASLPEQRRA